MHRAHPVRDGWVTWQRPDTLVCRCEEVPVGAVREAVTELGADDARTVKLLTRAGMGWCQGRMCGEAVARIVSATAGRDHDAYADALGSAVRPVAAPVSLAAVAAGRPLAAGPTEPLDDTGTTPQPRSDHGGPS